MEHCNPHPHNPFAQTVCPGSPFGVLVVGILALAVLALIGLYALNMRAAGREHADVEPGPEVAARAVPTHSRAVRWSLATVAAVVVAAGAFVTVLAASTATAHAAPANSSEPLVVTYAAPTGDGRLYVETTRRTYPHLKPCRAEDDWHCFWDATTRGNLLGQPVVRVHGRTLPYTVAAS